MAGRKVDRKMAVNVQLKAEKRHNCYELLAWLNSCLHTRFTTLEQTCTGVAFCQIMDRLFPGSVDLSQVWFQPEDMEHSIRNYSVLQAGFMKTGVVQPIPVTELIQGAPETVLDFLSWFKSFFDANHSARDYNAVEARGGQNMVPINRAKYPAASPDPTSAAGSQMPDTRNCTKFTRKDEKGAPENTCRRLVLELKRISIKREMKARREEEEAEEGVTRVKTDAAEEIWNEARKETEEDVMTVWKETETDGGIGVDEGKMDTTITHEENNKMEEKTQEVRKRNVEQIGKEEFGWTEKEDGCALSHFIWKYWSASSTQRLRGEDKDLGQDKIQKILQGLARNQGQKEGQCLEQGKGQGQCEDLVWGLSRSTARQVLGREYHQDILHTCLHTPYALYLYHHVSLRKGETPFVLLIGYFHQRSGDRVVRLLDALQPKEDTSAALLACLKKTLSSLSLPLANLAWFYCDVANQEELYFLEAGVRKMNPRVVSLCGLTDLSGRACHAGVAAMSDEVVELVRAVYRHHSTFTTTHNNLQELFAEVPSFDPSLPVSLQCLFFTKMIQGIVHGHSDLLGYFSALGGTGDAVQICSRLRNLRLRVLLLFLDHALKPLAAFQDTWQRGRADLEGLLQVAATLLRSYCNRFLCPSAARSFLRCGNLLFLSNQVYHLESSEVDVGGARTRDFFLENAALLVDANCIREQLPHIATDFYREVTRTLSSSLLLSDASLMHIASLLQSPGSTLVTGNVVRELADQLGVCRSVGVQAEEGDAGRLSEEYQEYLKGEEERRGKVPSSRTGRTAEQHWGRVLKGLDQSSVFRRLLLTLLALPITVHREAVSTQAFHHFSEVPANPGAPELRKEEEELPAEKPSPQATPCDEWLTDDETAPFSLPSPSLDMESDTDDSSEVMEVTEFKLRPAVVEKSNALLPKMSESIVIDDDEDDDVIWLDTVNAKLKEQSITLSLVTSTAEGPEGRKKSSFYQDGCGYDVGELVWGHMEGSSLWPCEVRVWNSKPVPSKMRRVEWYGKSILSKTSTQCLKPFAAFAQCFCAKSFANQITYKEAIFKSLQVAAERSKMVFSLNSVTKEEQLVAMLDWAFGGFKPSGPSGFTPPPFTQANRKKRRMNKRKVSRLGVRKSNSTSTPNSDSNAPSLPTKLKKLSLSEGGLIHPLKHRRSRARLSQQAKRMTSVSPQEDDSSQDGQPSKAPLGQQAKRMTSVPPQEDDGQPSKAPLGQQAKHRTSVSPSEDNSSPDGQPSKAPRVQRAKRRTSVPPQEEDPFPDWQPPHKRTSSYYKAKESSYVYVRPHQQHREAMVKEVLSNGTDIEGLCLCCGTDDVQIQHPLFTGGLCARCKDNFTETLYRYDEDGYQSYCTVCCAGLEVILCGNDSCCRSYCVDCLNILVASETFEQLKEVDPWVCFLCQPIGRHGALQPRCDWSVRVQAFFANNSAMEFEPHRVYPSIPPSLRQPIRVLSLFDGIGTGYLVLKDLGFKVKEYVASEVCEESISVSTINHEGKIIQVDDVRFITQEHVKKWGPFDLLIGGSPCNDLSIVNPIRKGLFEGTGRLFFEFYRILDLLKPKDNNSRPFFWLFENVVFMNTHDRLNICRYLECNPVMVDAVKVSPAHRARYFWGNIPGMNRPITASQSDKLSLQECLEIGRSAKFTKIRTITTNPASMKQGNSKLPVLDENGKEDNLWITELEQIFGFPKHYTDVKNMNRQQRQKVLGKSWSVPVIRHLFAPLKDYFACEQLPL